MKQIISILAILVIGIVGFSIYTKMDKGLVTPGPSSVDPGITRDPNAPLPIHFNTYGILLAINEAGIDSSGSFELNINQEAANCERIQPNIVSIKTFWKTSKEDILEIEKKYLFEFIRYDENEDWGLIKASRNLDSCSKVHNYDLGTKQATTRINPALITSNGLTKLELNIINRQDNEIPYTIGDLAIVDEYVLYNAARDWKIYPELVQGARVGGCSVSTGEKKGSVSPKSTKKITFDISCNSPKVCQFTALNPECYYFLWGNVIFTDELGIEHKLNAREQVLQQYLKFSESELE